MEQYHTQNKPEEPQTVELFHTSLKQLAMVELKPLLTLHQQPQMVELLHTFQEQPQTVDILHTLLTHQLPASHHQAHTEPQMVEPSHTHMLPPHQDMKPSPMKLNQPHTEDQSPMLTQLPAMVDHQPVPNRLQLDIHQESQSHTSLKPPQTEEPYHTLMKLKPLHTVDKSPTSLKPLQMEELNQRPSHHTPHQMEELPQFIQEQPAMEDTLHQPSYHQPAHHMSHPQSHTQPQMVDKSPTHMFQLHQDMKQLHTTQSQPHTVEPSHM